ncbi:hypothetical protein [Tenacibaculum discolor]|uniref:hypothetical protein n=1 Tax=Tenacibaculum discolor TaxID=361581 RepID=UPI003F7B131C
MKKIILLFFVFAPLTIKAQNYSFEWESSYITFVNGVENQVSYIDFGDINMWGWMEVTITSAFGYRLSTGKYTKRYQIGKNLGKEGYFHHTSEVPVAFGHVASEWKLGELEFNDNNRLVIPIYHLLSTGNTIVVTIKGVNRISGFNSTTIQTTPVYTLANNQTADRTYLKQNFTIENNLTVGTHKLNNGDKLTVAGKIGAREIKVTVDSGADFVFENDYKLVKLDSLQKYILKNKHLPDISSEKEMQNNGIELSKFSIQLLQKIEELTLYTIQQQKELEAAKEKNNTLERRLNEIEKLIKSKLVE